MGVNGMIGIGHGIGRSWLTRSSDRVEIIRYVGQKLLCLRWVPIDVHISVIS